MALQTDIYWATQLNAKYYIYRPVSLSDNPTDYNKWTEMTPEEKADFDNKLSSGLNIIMCYVDKTMVDTQVLAWYKKDGTAYKKYEGNNWQTITDTTETDALKDTNKNLILVVKSDKVAELKSFESKAIKVAYYLIRHGFSCANVKKREQTVPFMHKLLEDPLLHKIGIAQSMFLGYALKKLNISLDAICSSQLQRAAQTAHCINLGIEAESKESSIKKIYLLPNINEVGIGKDNSPTAYKQVIKTNTFQGPPEIVDTCDPSQTEEQCTTELEIKKETFLLELGKRILPVLKDISSAKTDITIGIVVHQNLLQKIKDVVFPNSGLLEKFENTSTLVIPNVSYLVNDNFTRINSQTTTDKFNNATQIDWGTFDITTPSFSYIKPAYPLQPEEYLLDENALCDETKNTFQFNINNEDVTSLYNTLTSEIQQSADLKTIVTSFNGIINLPTQKSQLLNQYLTDNLVSLTSKLASISQNP